MKVFANEAETSFFKTDDFIKNLHEVEISSIETFLRGYALDSNILLGVKSWMVGRFDELIPGNPYLDDSKEPALHGEWLDIDFMDDLRLLDILVEISKFKHLDSDQLSEIKQSNVFNSVKSEMINDDCDEKWTISVWDDPRTLLIFITSDDIVSLEFR